MLLPLLACVLVDSFPSALSEQSFFRTAHLKRNGELHLFSLNLGHCTLAKNGRRKVRRSLSIRIKLLCLENGLIVLLCFCAKAFGKYSYVVSIGQ